MTTTVKATHGNMPFRAEINLADAPEILRPLIATGETPPDAEAMATLKNLLPEAHSVLERLYFTFGTSEYPEAIAALAKYNLSNCRVVMSNSEHIIEALFDMINSVESHIDFVSSKISQDLAKGSNKYANFIAGERLFDGCIWNKLIKAIARQKGYYDMNIKRELSNNQIARENLCVAELAYQEALRWINKSDPEMAR